MNKPRILFWHRRDLRIFDNQALIKAFSLSNAITSTYILDKNYSHDFNASSRAWFLGNSLQELGNNWKKMGSRLVLEEGDPVFQQFYEYDYIKGYYYSSSNFVRIFLPHYSTLLMIQ